MIQIKLTDQQHEDLIVTALEGGSNFWYDLSDEAIKIINNATKGQKEPLSIRFWKALQNGAVIPINDIEEEDSKIGEISLASIEKGEQLLADKYPSHLADILSESGDANTADVWFQLCTLGEVVYG